MTAEATEEVAAEEGEFEERANVARSGTRSGTVIFGKINRNLKT